MSLVVVGDASVSRLNKDGIGSAYITSKAAVTTALIFGVSGKDFKKHYWPVCKTIINDNRFGRMVYYLAEVSKSNMSIGWFLFLYIRSGLGIVNETVWGICTGSLTYGRVVFNVLNPITVPVILFGYL